MRTSLLIKSGAVALAALLLCAQAQAARILVLTTNESASDAQTMTTNCANEFTALRPGHEVVVLPGKLNNNATPLTAEDLSPVAGPYDIVVTCTVYQTANAQAVDVIAAGMANRAARAFFNFDEHISFMPAFIAAKSDWALALSDTVKGDPAESQALNARSRYAAPFTGLATLGGHAYRAYTGVPLDNALYTPSGDPIPADSDVVPGASIMLVPTEQSYLDASGVAQGACLFQSTDISMFDRVRYGGTRGKIATAFINATAPSGACSPSPSIDKRFEPSTVPVGGTSELTIRIHNNGGYTDSTGAFHPAAPVDALRVHDALPAPLQLSGTPVTTCTGGTLAGAPGESALTLAGATLPPEGCTITAEVIWPASGVTACGAAPLLNTIRSASDFSSALGAGLKDATATLACAPMASIQVGKTAAQTQVRAGAAAEFTVTVTNLGPVAGTGIAFSDPLGVDWASAAWTCSATGGATCPGVSGTGDPDVTGLSLPPGGGLSYAITSVATGEAATATNAVSVNPGSGQCVSGVSPCTASVSLAVLGGVTISTTLLTPAVAEVGDTVQYMVQLNNPTGADLTQPIALSDLWPGVLTGGTWTCSGECSGLTSGAMPLSASLPGLVAHGSVTFTISGEVAPSAAGQTIHYDATAAGPDVCLDGRPSCSAAAGPVRVPVAALVQPVPTLDPWALGLLSLLLGSVVSRRLRRP